MSRTMVSSVVAATLFFLCAAPVAAADAEAQSVGAASIADSASLAAASDINRLLSSLMTDRPDPSRGHVLPTLYVGLAGLNAFDAYSTSRGLSLGAGEANPLMQPVASSPAAIWLVKGGVTAASITVAERLWRQHRRGSAIAVMVISNGVMAAVATRNASVLRGARK